MNDAGVRTVSIYAETYGCLSLYHLNQPMEDILSKRLLQTSMITSTLAPDGLIITIYSSTAERDGWAPGPVPFHLL